MDSAEESFEMVNEQTQEYVDLVFKIRDEEEYDSSEEIVETFRMRKGSTTRDALNLLIRNFSLFEGEKPHILDCNRGRLVEIDDQLEDGTYSITLGCEDMDDQRFDFSDFLTIGNIVTLIALSLLIGYLIFGNGFVGHKNVQVHYEQHSKELQELRLIIEVIQGKLLKRDQEQPLKFKEREDKYRETIANLLDQLQRQKAAHQKEVQDLQMGKKTAAQNNQPSNEHSKKIRESVKEANKN